MRRLRIAIEEDDTTTIQKMIQEESIDVDAYISVCGS